MRYMALMTGSHKLSDGTRRVIRVGRWYETEEPAVEELVTEYPQEFWAPDGIRRGAGTIAGLGSLVASVVALSNSSGLAALSGAASIVAGLTVRRGATSALEASATLTGTLSSPVVRKSATASIESNGAFVAVVRARRRGQAFIQGVASSVLNILRIPGIPI